MRARDRLTRLVNRQRDATDALRANLVAAYRNPLPDIVSVVVNAQGFTELLEQADFLKRVARQNALIMDRARTSRAAVTKQANSLATMQARELRLGAELERRRDRAQVLETALLSEQQRRLAGRASKRSALREIQSQLASLRERLARSARNGIVTRPGGMAQAPPGAPAAVGLVIAAGNAIAGLPYLYGGGHGGFKDTRLRLLGLDQLRARRRGARPVADGVGPVHELGRGGARQVDHGLREPGACVHGRRRLALRHDARCAAAARAGRARCARRAASSPATRPGCSPAYSSSATGTPKRRRSSDSSEPSSKYGSRPAVVGAQLALRPRRILRRRRRVRASWSACSGASGSGSGRTGA